MNIILDNIEIIVIKKNVKNIHLTVHPPYGTVKLTVPKKMDDEAINRFAKLKLSWIKKQREKFKSQECIEPLKYNSGEIHYYFGEEYKLNVIETKGKQYAEIRDDECINLYVKPNSTVEKREKIMNEWYRNNLKTAIPELVNKWEKTIMVSVNECRIKSMKTRWGTCNIKDKRIWINLELSKKNPNCLEFIVVHEMTHLLERYHNKNFYGYMDKFFPEWRTVQKELNGII